MLTLWDKMFLGFAHYFSTPPPLHGSPLPCHAHGSSWHMQQGRHGRAWAGRNKVMRPSTKLFMRKNQWKQNGRKNLGRQKCGRSGSAWAGWRAWQNQAVKGLKLGKPEFPLSYLVSSYLILWNLKLLQFKSREGFMANPNQKKWPQNCVSFQLYFQLL